MERIFSVENLDCAHCGAKIEEAIRKIEGVESAVLNFPMKRIKIKGDITDELISKINEKANDIEPGVVIRPSEGAHHSHKHEHHHHHDEDDHGHHHCDYEHEHHHHGEECSCGHDHHSEHAHSEKSRSILSGDVLPLIAGIVLFAAALLCGKLLDIKWLTIILYDSFF